MNSQYDALLNCADAPLVDDDKNATDAGMQVIRAIKDRTSALMTTFGSLHGQMDEYEELWRLEAVRWQTPEDKQFNRYLPAFATNEPRVLTNRLERACTKDRVQFRVELGQSQDDPTRERSQRLERYLSGAFYMADMERRRVNLGYVQNTLAWALTVRGCGIIVPIVRASKRQKNSDEYGDEDPFQVRTPDPRECVFEESADGLAFFAHHFWRAVEDCAGKDHLEGIRPTNTRDGLCMAWNVWWLDAKGEVWNASVIEDRFFLPPANHTTARGLRYLPVTVDSAEGAPAEFRVTTSAATGLKYHMQGPLETNKDAYAVSNTINAFNMFLMKSSVFSSLATFSERKLTDQELQDIFNGRGVLRFDREDKAPQYIAPPQLSETLQRWSLTLDRMKAAGGLPDQAGANIPQGMSGLAIAETALQGDVKAGPIVDALKRMFLEAGHCILRQHKKLNRQITVQGKDINRRPFIDVFKPGELPKPGEYMIETVLDPFLVRDEYRDAQTAATLATAGFPFLSIADKYSKDPVEEENRRIEQLIKADPGVQALEMARVAQDIMKRPDIAAFFTAKAMGTLKLSPAGVTNAPRAGMPSDAAPMPMSTEPAPPLPPESDPSQLLGMVNPTEPGTQELLGAIGAAEGGDIAY